MYLNFLFKQRFGQFLFGGMSSAQVRKRRAVSALRNLADEVGVDAVGRQGDLNASSFRRFYDNVLPVCSTPEQRRRAEAALAEYENRVLHALPAVPRLPPLPTSVPAAISNEARQVPANKLF